MKSVGIVGYRGMVGRVLVDRMVKEGDFALFLPEFFSATDHGQELSIGNQTYAVKDSLNIAHLSEMDIIISCQGGDYTDEVHPKLRASGWGGYWIDAASALRMKENAVIILDPVNQKVIDRAREENIKDFIGGNCTVSLMLMAVGVLFDKDLVEWMTSMTYQAASGGGARHMKELLGQFFELGNAVKEDLNHMNALELEELFSQKLRSNSIDTTEFGVPLAGNLIPWIDRAGEGGQTREEWKGQSESNKILGREERPVPIDGTCVRVGTLRCHAQALTIKLKEDIPLAQIEKMIREQNEWVEFVENEKGATLEKLTPRYVSGSLKIVVGRVRKMNLGPTYLNVFTCGDQLLWGAAEPLRRMALQLI